MIGRNPLQDVIPEDKIVIWDVPDPIGVDMDGFRRVRDQIKGLVEGLVQEHSAL